MLGEHSEMRQVRARELQMVAVLGMCLGKGKSIIGMFSKVRRAAEGALMLGL